MPPEDPVRPANAAPPVADPEQPLRDAYEHHRILRVQVGDAAYYHSSLAGNATASGEPYDPRGFTAAHRSLPFGTIVRVVRQSGRNVYVRINDRGPFGDKRRIIDLSRAAAERLGLVAAGTLQVRVEVLAYGWKRR